MAETPGHHENLGLDVLLDVATPQLYRTNAFRVLGLSIDVDGAEMNRRHKKLKLLEKLGGAASQNQHGVLPLTLPPDSDAIRRAGQRLHDMQLRLVDELFWLWPQDRPDTGRHDEGMELLSHGNINGAHDAWERDANEADYGYVARHNLAVLNHAMALDIEDSVAGQDQPFGPEVLALRDKYWQAAMEHWVSATTDEALWSHLETRASILDDPRLTPDFVRRLRQSLPAAILSISINLAVGAAKRGYAEQARRHLAYVRESSFDTVLTDRLLEREASALVDQVRRACEPIAERSKSAPATADRLAEAVLEDCELPLTGVQALLDEEHHLHQTACDLVAGTVRNCMIEYGNKTEDWDRCVPILEQAYSMALDEGLRSRLRGDISQAKENRKGQENEEALGLVTKAIATAESGRPDEGLRLLRRALVACKDPDLKSKISNLINQANETRREASRQRAADWLTELVGRVIGIAVIIGVVCFIGWIADSCDSSHSPSRPSSSGRSYSSQRSSTSTRSYSGLSSRIDSGKMRVRALEAEIEQMDSELESLSASIERYKREIEGYERRTTSAMPVDEYSYRQALDRHNRLVVQYNSLLMDRNLKYNEYKREIDSVNDMVARYNRGER